MKTMTVATLVLALAACSAGPGKGEVESALGAFFEQNAGAKPIFEGLEVGSCQRSEGSPGYACAVSGQAQFDLGGRKQRETLTGTFVLDKVGGRWTVIGTR